MTLDTQAWTILLMPLLAFVAIIFFTRSEKDLSSLTSILAMLVSTVLSYSAFFQALGGAHVSSSFNWLQLVPSTGHEVAAAGHSAIVGPGAGPGFLELGIQIDPLTALMLVVVTTVSLLVQVYSRGYMVEHGQKDPSYSRFFAYLSLFTFSMLGLVLANNLLFLFISWELVGLSSYLLISFWFHKPEAWIAGKKAFLTTRVGDIGFLIGLLILWNVGGTLSFEELFHQAEAGPAGGSALFNASLFGMPVLFWACLGLFAGAVGKSGQFPLHVWLPDAMEGPTPVSALIHAATMVAAGVYLVARTFPLFEAVPSALTVVGWIGGFTAIFAATMGLVNNDIKRVLAFSTVSQLGYMMLALGVGAPGAAMFHLFTHAFFKALLFLGSGSVIHATETNDIREMGGLRKVMPVTFWTMLIGSLSLAGVPIFAGFWSKDEILTSVAHNGNMVLLVFGMITVFLTAFYTFRMFILTFGGEYRGHHHPHESPPVMIWPLIILAVPSVAVGFWGSPFMDYGFQRFVEGSHFHLPSIDFVVMGSSVLLAVLGIALAYLVYGTKAISAVKLGAAFGPMHRILLNRWYVDELYMKIIDIFAIGVAKAVAAFDRNVLDGIVNGLANLTNMFGGGLRGMATGRTQNYGLVMFSGVAAIAGLLLLQAWLRP